MISFMYSNTLVIGTNRLIKILSARGMSFLNDDCIAIEYRYEIRKFYNS